MNPLDVIQRLAVATSRSQKEQIVFDAFMQDCNQFFVAARLALDPLILFGVTKVTEILEDDDEVGEFTFGNFIELAEKLRRRELSSTSARTAIHSAAEHCDTTMWNQFYRHILLKDLKVGVDAKTINKVLQKLLPAYPKAQDYFITIFGCQMAHNGDDPKYKAKAHGRKLIDTKLDGVRILAAIDPKCDSVDLFTHQGHLIENLPKIHGALLELLPKLPAAMMLDGMLVSPHGSQRLTAMLRNKAPLPDDQDVRYALFDILPLDDFRAGCCPKTQRERHALLEVMHECGLRYVTNGRVYVVPQIEVDLDLDEGQFAYAEFARQAVTDGYEGLMTKDPDASYCNKRTTAWLEVSSKILL